MKLICPLCKKQLNFKDWDKLDTHFYSEHGYEGGLTSDYAYLIFQLWDRINLLKERKKIEGKTEVPMYTNSVIGIFESLLK